MAQSVDTDFFTKANLVDDLLHWFLHGALGHRVFGSGSLLVIASLGGEQQSRMSMREPILSQPSKCDRRDRHVAVLGTFAAVDVNQAAGCIDVTDV